MGAEPLLAWVPEDAIVVAANHTNIAMDRRPLEWSQSDQEYARACLASLDASYGFIPTYALQRRAIELDGDGKLA